MTPNIRGVNQQSDRGHPDNGASPFTPIKTNLNRRRKTNGKDSDGDAHGQRP